eukprot:TRINITY_DN8180_c0_g1_i2.p1 TRINITY_DN8180_c0_g1~~TRINITY_DN8180_c0_g1_i2.p1  ORF type:complete len:125 (+),score=33.43 TRINITY_DN8180_c0_g1_i2:49-375(+)
MTEPFPQEQEREYTEAFRFFDKQNTGRIEAKDLGALMRSLGENLPDNQLQSLCAGGSIDLNSFIGYWVRKWENAHAYEEIVQCFRFFDFEKLWIRSRRHVEKSTPSVW